MKWKKVFYVLGNHEYYPRSDLEKTDITQGYQSCLEEHKLFFQQYNNVFLLENDKTELEEFTVLGCTLWSFPMKEAEKVINDFIFISVNTENKNLRRFTVEDCRDNHQTSLDWIKQNYNPDKPTILLTHFPINNIGTSHPKYHTQLPEITSYFLNDLHFEPSENLVCISGHTHYSHDYIKEGVRYLSNQKGYLTEAKETMFRSNGLFVL